MRCFVSLGALIFAIFSFGLVGAPDVARAEESWGYDLGHELMSPYCPGRTLATCPSPQAAELVQWIVLQEAGGATKEEVIDSLIERFGEEILGAPKAEGFAIWAYVLPILGFIVGGGLAAVVLRRIVASDSGTPVLAEAGGSATAEAAGSDDELGRLIDAELDRRA